MWISALCLPCFPRSVRITSAKLAVYKSSKIALVCKVHKHKSVISECNRLFGVGMLIYHHLFPLISDENKYMYRKRTGFTSALTMACTLYWHLRANLHVSLNDLTASPFSCLTGVSALPFKPHASKALNCVLCVFVLNENKKCNENRVQFFV